MLCDLCAVQLIITSVLSIIAAILNAQGLLSAENGSDIHQIVRLSHRHRP